MIITASKGAIVMENRCVCCGKIIPEGQWICEHCMMTVEVHIESPSRVEQILKLQRQAEDQRRKYCEGMPKHHYYDGMVDACVMIQDILHGGEK